MGSYDGKRDRLRLCGNMNSTKTPSELESSKYKHTQVDARDGKWPSGWFKMIENGRLRGNKSSTKMPNELESLKVN
ncbi:hypothetical protein QJS10_CPA05g00696 [Acorus calamus]|uniref:Uncharacterized protein n=1 Tax=Acorus calamus TaxID=4465 RepID=A0AAV9ETI8_ACOCL|nr:hypothetical protein QJS10_CPA05g00696 [Acorus calamus]